MKFIVFVGYRIVSVGAQPFDVLLRVRVRFAIVRRAFAGARALCDRSARFRRSVCVFGVI